MGPHQEGTGAMVAAHTGALPSLGHIKSQEKHLTVIEALNCVSAVVAGGEKDA